MGTGGVGFAGTGGTCLVGTGGVGFAGTGGTCFAGRGGFVDMSDVVVAVVFGGRAGG